VRSTSDSSDDAKVSGSEKVYRRLSRLIAEEQYGNAIAEPEAGKVGSAPTRFVVDIVSGTSAGGINGVFLAKALANGQDIKSLEGLWIEQGEIQRLIYDKKSLEDRLELEDPPPSLLNSQRMYLELLKALDGMDDDGVAKRSPYIDELDLFVTATDMRGVTLPLRLADGVVCERRHRNVLHFAYSKREVSGDDDDRNDFEPGNNPFLAYAARCTSAFPFAFQPMRLDDIDSILQGRNRYTGKPEYRSDSPRWQKFYKDYANAMSPGSVPFPARSFNDGGVLDNKPFSYATETLSHRQADVPVDRKLIYIEPSPEHPELQSESADRPNALENVQAALSLPRDETIREDLQRILERNRLIQRGNRIMQGVERDAEMAQQRATQAVIGADAITQWKALGALAPLPPTEELWAQDALKDDQWATLDLADMVKRKGQSYLAYHRLEIAETTDQLARLVARVSGLDEESDYFLIVRGLIRAWRDMTFAEYRDAEDQRRTMNAFLVAFGLSYPIRRLNFLRNKIDDLCELDDEAVASLSRRYLGLWDEDRPTDDQKKEMRATMLRIKRELNDIYVSLRRQARLIRSRSAGKDGKPSTAPPNPVRDNILALTQAIRAATAQEVGERASSDALLDYFLGGGDATDPSKGLPRHRSDGSTDDQCTAAARDLLSKHPELLKLMNDAASAIEERVGAARKEAHTRATDLLTTANTSDQRDDATNAVSNTLWHYYKRYVDYDMVSFPLFFETDVGESDVVEVIRVSPEDARALIDEGKTGCRKLAGTAIGHFGAFLDELWRKNDILWGRLDGAERLISALLPNHPRTRELIGEAQAEILAETIEKLGKVELYDLLVESFMRTRNATADNEAVNALSTYLSNLKSYSPPELKEKLDLRITDSDLRDYYLKVFQERSKLRPEPTLKTAARATTVIGKVFSGVAKDFEDRGKSVPAAILSRARIGAWLARFGMIFSGLIEVAVPQSIPHLVFRHWLKLLYTFEVFTIVAATLLSKEAVVQFGWTILGITVGVNIVVWWLRDFMSGRTSVAHFVVAVLVLMFAGLALIGALKVSDVVFGLNIRGLSVLNWLHIHLDNFDGWMRDHVSGPVWTIVKVVLPPLVVIGFVVLLWMRARPKSPSR
jgi:patatin-related protein